MVTKTVTLGTCDTCGSEVKSYQVYLGSVDARGITLEAGTKETGHWAWCINPNCENNHGEGTLPRRPREL